MIKVLLGPRMFREYAERIILDPDLYYRQFPLSQFTADDLIAIKDIEGADYLPALNLFVSKIKGTPAYSDKYFSSGCKTLLNFFHDSTARYIHDFTSAGPNVWNYLFSMQKFGPHGESRIIYSSYMPDVTLPSWGVFFNNNPELYHTLDAALPYVMEALDDDSETA